MTDRRGWEGPAQREIAEAMTTALGLWFAPGVSGVACNLAEAHMVERIIARTGNGWGDKEADEIYWFFRKRYLALNVATYIPWVGPPLQVLEVFALGQFAITCARKKVNVQDVDQLAAAWSEIQPDVWAGARVIEFYERNSGKEFPAKAREPFVKAVDTASKAAHAVGGAIPFASEAQELAGDTLRSGIGLAKKGLKKLFS